MLPTNMCGCPIKYHSKIQMWHDKLHTLLRITLQHFCQTYFRSVSAGVERRTCRAMCRVWATPHGNQSGNCINQWQNPTAALIPPNWCLSVCLCVCVSVPCGEHVDVDCIRSRVCALYKAPKLAYKETLHQEFKFVFLCMCLTFYNTSTNTLILSMDTYRAESILYYNMHTLLCTHTARIYHRVHNLAQNVAFFAYWISIIQCRSPVHMRLHVSIHIYIYICYICYTAVAAPAAVQLEQKNEVDQAASITCEMPKRSICTEVVATSSTHSVSLAIPRYNDSCTHTMCISA